MTTVVFMGSPDFSLPTLRALSQAYDVVGVVTQPDRASGRGRELKAPPVKTLALELGIPVMQPEKLRQPEAMEQLRAWSPDLIVVAAFGQILRKDVLELPRFGCINVHASLLPRWRGAAPINAAILHGDEETGVTIMIMDVGLDTGPMLSKRSIRLTRDDTAGSAFEKLSRLGADLLIETLPDYLSGKLTPAPQPEEGVTYAPMIKKEEGRLGFHPGCRVTGAPGARLQSLARCVHGFRRDAAENPSGTGGNGTRGCRRAACGPGPARGRRREAGSCSWRKCSRRGKSR